MKKAIKRAAQLAITFAAVSLTGIAAFFLLQQARAQEEELRYFAQALDPAPRDVPIVRVRTTNTIGGQPGADMQNQIAVAFHQSFRALAKAQVTGNADQLRDHFTGTALVRSIYTLNSTPTGSSQMAFLGMGGELALHHLDNSITQIESEDAIFARFVVENGTLKHYRLSRDCITSLMFLKTTGWTVSNHELRCSDEISTKSRGEKPSFPKLHGINYYPADTPWTAFWEKYDPEIIKGDIALMQELGANSVRFFLPYEAFLHNPEYLVSLRDFLQQTADADLWVIPTLFDFRGDLQSWNWGGDREYLDAIIPIISEFDNVAYIDVKNELDLDLAYQDKAVVEAWALTMIGLIREMSDKPLSLGWSKAQMTEWMADSLDVISYHEYQPLSNTRINLDFVERIAAGKPVIVSEIGASSFGIALSQPSSPDKQAEELANRLNALEGAHGTLTWTLHDFDWLDPKAIGGSSWNKNIQRNFGLFDREGEAKPAASIFSSFSIQ